MVLFQRYPWLFCCNFPSSSLVPAEGSSHTHTAVNWHLPPIALPQHQIAVWMRSLL